MGSCETTDDSFLSNKELLEKQKQIVEMKKTISILNTEVKNLEYQNKALSGEISMKEITQPKPTCIQK